MLSTGHRVLIAFSLALAGMAGCSAGGRERGRSREPLPPYESGVSAGTQLSALSASEQQAICRSRAEYVSAAVDTTGLARFWCSLTPAVRSALDAYTCSTELERCVALTSVDIELQLGADARGDCYLNADLSRCRGTVADLERCVEVSVDEQVTISDLSICGGGASVSLGPSVDVLACDALGPECAAYREPEPGPVVIY